MSAAEEGIPSTSVEARLAALEATTTTLCRRTESLELENAQLKAVVRSLLGGAKKPNVLPMPMLHHMVAPDLSLRNAPEPLTFGDIEETEVLLNICSFLGLIELSRLACVSASFGRKLGWQRRRVGGAAAPPEMHSVVEEAARRWVLTYGNVESVVEPAAATAETELSTLDSGQAPVIDEIGWLRQLKDLLRSLRVHSDLELSSSPTGPVVTKKTSSNTGWRTAMGNAVMGAGTHYAVFTLMRASAGNMMFGLVRPDWDVVDSFAPERGAQNVDRHCFYQTRNGLCVPGDSRWPGIQTARENDRVGLLLELDNGGSLSVYKNDVRLGTMATGLTGEFCWAGCLLGKNTSCLFEIAPIPGHSQYHSST